jgi:hypothetical protein
MLSVTLRRPRPQRGVLAVSVIPKSQKQVDRRSTQSIFPDVSPRPRRTRRLNVVLCRSLIRMYIEGEPVRRRPSHFRDSLAALDALQRFTQAMDVEAFRIRVPFQATLPTIPDALIRVNDQYDTPSEVISRCGFERGLRIKCSSNCRIHCKRWTGLDHRRSRPRPPPPAHCKSRNPSSPLCRLSCS